MNSPVKVEKKPTSLLTYIVGIVAIVAITLVTWHELYQGIDAEKAAALARQKAAEEQIKNGTYEFAKKWGPPTAGALAASHSGENANSDSTGEVTEKNKEAGDKSAEVEANSKEPSSPEASSSKKENE